MTSKSVRIVESSPWHVRDLGQNLREGDYREGLALGYKPANLLFYSYRQGLMRRTAFVDGQIAAMWGVAGIPMGLVGRPYLITSPACEEISPIRFVSIYRKEVVEMGKLFPLLENYVDSSYIKAVRMLELAGFTIDEPIPLGPIGSLFNRFSKVTQ